MKTQIIARLKWYFGNRENPRPSWYYHTDHWITDEQEIINAIRLDDEMGIKDE